MKRIGKILITVVSVVLLVLTSACALEFPEEEEGVTPQPPLEEGQGIIEIRVTDPPPADVESAVIYLSSIEVHRVSGSASEWVMVSEDTSSFDLMDVIGVEEVLTAVQTQSGNFTQIRMDVDRVEVLTVDGESITAEVPGEKLKIVRPFRVEAGVKTVLTLDFDGEKSLILRGKDTATGERTALFKPVVKLLIEKEEVEAKQEREKEKEQEGEEEEFEGTIEAIDGDIWKVAIESENRTVDVSQAEIDGEPSVGLRAEIEGTVVDDTILASEVKIEEAEGPGKDKEREKEQEGEEEEFEGTIEAIDGDIWTVAIESENRTVDVSQAEIDGKPAVGLQVEIEGTVVDDTILADEVDIKETEE